MKRLIVNIVCGVIGLSVMRYFNLDTFWSFVAGGITYGIADILSETKISLEY